MFSPADFLSFRNMLNAAEHSNDRSVEDVYGAMLHKDAMYMLKFDGNYREVALRFNKESLSDTELDKKYKKYVEEKYPFDIEKAFIKFVEGVIFDGSVSFDDGFHLYEVKTDNKGSLTKSTEKYADKKSSNCK